LLTQNFIHHLAKLLVHYFSIENGKKQLEEFYDQELSQDIKDELSIFPDNKHFDLLSDVFGSTGTDNNLHVPYSNFLNRASFWMATGSGKTLIIIKLIELLYELMEKGVIPEKKVLIITPNDDIFGQIKKHVDDFNNASFRYKEIFLKDIKEYEQMEFAGINPLQPDSLTVYHTKSILITNENKEKMIDYKSYIEREGWYIILDEAHKGDAEDSTIKQYINVLAKNGFLFNFSATFTDTLDIVSTIINFNLSEFIRAGYGKNIKVLDEEFKNFRARNKKELENNLSDDSKVEIILKSFIVFTAIKKNFEVLKNINHDLYHNPLMLTISNEINTSNADMKLFFNCMKVIAAEQVPNEVLDAAKSAIIRNLQENIQYTLGDGELNEHFIRTIRSVTYNDILRYVFNSNSNGAIEVLQIGSNNDELSFRLKTSSSEPFAIIKAASVNKWKNNVLLDYRFDDDVVTGESRFKDIHKRDNPINILMGSRQFIEGWDSNRPNVINFINMGTNDENTKLILQAIGRGVRSEPLPNIRTRFKYTNESNRFNEDVRNQILQYGELLETLFVFATNKQVVSNILREINIEDEWNLLPGIQRTKIKEVLLVPDYKTVDSNTKKFRFSNNDYKAVEEFVNHTSEKLLVVRDGLNIKTISSFKKKERLTIRDEKSRGLKPIELLRNFESHLNMKSKVLVGFRKEKKNIDIRHYKHIQTLHSGEDLLKLEGLIKNAIDNRKSQKSYNDKQKDFAEDLLKMLQSGQKPGKTMIEVAESMGIQVDELLKDVAIQEQGREYGIQLKNIKQHYYKPLVLSESKKFKHVISVESEIRFLNQLENYINREGNQSEEFDWWYFSKIEEGIDKINIPYYDSYKQIYRDFFPDFIFWMKRNDKYYIKFVDPKGLLLNQSNAIDKANGFEEVFGKKDLSESLNVKAELLFYNEGYVSDSILQGYKFQDLNDLFKIEN
jgi:type III restriction enzyme